jgi:hypothetical protein
MKRVCGHVLAALAVLAGGASVTSACVHDDSTIFVFDVLAPQEVSNGASCVFTSDTTQPYISSGVIDIDFGANGYFAEYLVGNQMVPQGNPSTPQNETSYVTIRNVVVRITDTAEPPNQLTTFTQAASATIPPLNGTTPSFAPIGVLTIDHNTLHNPNVFNVVAGGGGVRLLTYVIFKGITTGGDNVESGEFEFPVDVCKGCLISFAAQDINPDFVTPNCANATGTGGTALPAPCILGQDQSVDCSQCLGVPDCNPQLVVAPGVILDAGAG